MVDTIRLGTDIHRVVDEAEGALSSNAADVYVRAGALVKPVQEGRARKGIKRELGSTTIRVIERATLHELLTRHASWVRYDGRVDRDLKAQPPDIVVSALLARGEWPALRPLLGVIETPAIRPDGSVIQTPGYDEATGYLYQPSDTFGSIPSRPTLSDAHTARDRLFSLVQDFPFAGHEHRSAWLSAVLTLFARPAIDGCTPLFAIDATTPGTGKGMLADVIANIATGRDGTKATLPAEDEEFRKRISALLVEGDSLAILDNVKGTLASVSLDSCLTSTRWKDRRLGVTGTLTVDNRLVWIVTVNNLVLGADTARRTIHVRLETPLERPELRDDFVEPDLLGHIRRNRSRYVTDALTILLAHSLAGRPRAGAKSLGGFRSWSSVVAAACAWCGAGDPIETQKHLAENSDTVKSTLYPLIEGMCRLTAHESMSAKQVLGKLYPAPSTPDGYESLREAIEELAMPTGKQLPSAHRLGNALRKFRGRIAGGRSLVSDTDPSTNAQRWRVAGPETASPAPAVTNGASHAPEEAQGAFDDML